MTIKLVTLALLPQVQISVSQTALSWLPWAFFTFHYGIHKHLCSHLYGLTILPCRQKWCAHSGQACGFWSQTIWGKQGSRDHQLPRSHIVSDIRVSTERFGPECESLQGPCCQLLLFTPCFYLFCSSEKSELFPVILHFFVIWIIYFMHNRNNFHFWWV